MKSLQWKKIYRVNNLSMQKYIDFLPATARFRHHHGYLTSSKDGHYCYADQVSEFHFYFSMKYKATNKCNNCVFCLWFYSTFVPVFIYVLMKFEKKKIITHRCTCLSNLSNFESRLMLVLSRNVSSYLCNL